MNGWVTRAGFGIVLGASVLGGCAKERDPIDRVQANALQKSFFVGDKLNDSSDNPEFYYRGTLVDVGYGAGQEGLFTSTYAQPISRVKWEMTEKVLTARLSYERVGASDAHAGVASQKKGQVVAAFAIVSHFDIVRDYNATTGEELNVVVENTTDRAWYDRAYFRVDWSKNLVTDAYDYDTLSMLGVIGGVQYEALEYYTDDPNDPDYTHFEDGYFDVTQKAFAKPQTVTLPAEWGGGTMPACMLPGEVAGGSGPITNCNPVELKLRLSFRKVVDDDYEPANYDGMRFQAFGAFTTDRMNYARDYGVTDSENYHFTSRYNVWQQSHYYADFSAREGAIVCATPDATATTLGSVHADVHADANADGTEDACEAVTRATGVAGSRCDEFTRRCTLPYRSRETKMVTWYLHNEGPDDLFAPTKWAAQEWDLALRMAAQSAKYAECVKTESGDATSCAQQYPIIKGQQDDYDDAILVVRAVEECRRGSGWKAGACDQIADQTALRLKSAFGGRAPSFAAPIAALAKMPTMLALCHTPVADDDHPSCDPAWQRDKSQRHLDPRVGDIRYNLVNVINTPQTPSPWGIMVDGDDPLSGEKVSSSINIWNAVTDVASQGAIDIVRYINGELSTTDIESGKYVTNWVESFDGTPGGGPVGAMPTLSTDEVLHRVASVAGADYGAVKAAHEALRAGAPLPAATRDVANKAEALARTVRIDPSLSRNAASIQARFDSARGTALEATLTNQAMLQAAGVGTAAASGASSGAGTAGSLDPLTLAQASPLRAANPEFASAFYQAKQNALAARGACVLDEAPEFTGIVGLTKQLLEKFPLWAKGSGDTPDARAERMRRYLARRYQYGVIIHEMGHSVGLRHNFVSSYDAFTFRPQYWQLRTKNGKVSAPCTAAKSGADAAACVGPRYYDPVSGEESDNLVWMWEQSSVMDYPGDTSVDTLGLGVYDYAAARMFYGDVVSVFADDPSFPKLDLARTSRIVDKTDNFGGITGIKLKGPPDTATKAGSLKDHYSQIQNGYHVIGDCQAVDPATVTPPADYDPSVDGQANAVLDVHLVTVDGKYTKCRQRPVDYTFWGSLRAPDDKVFQEDAQDGVTLTNYRGGPVADAKNRVRVPYAFASDNWADLGNASVFRHDQGADQYEQFMFYITTSENRHIFDHYRRNRLTFNVRAAFQRDWDRYTSKMMNTAKGLGLYAGIYKKIAEEDGYEPSVIWSQAATSFLADNILAASVAMDHFSRELTRPQPGPHFFSQKVKGDLVLHSNDSSYYGSDNTNTSALTGESKPKNDVTVPDGTSGVRSSTGFTDVSLGGEPLNNALDHRYGDYASEHTYNVGSYYQKIWSVMAMTESRDNFISEDRGDFLDARYRATSMADVYPEGFRRLIANALTNDGELIGPRVAGSARQLDAAGNLKATPTIDVKTETVASTGETMHYPSHPIGWVSFWPTEGPAACFSENGSNLCETWLGEKASFAPSADSPADSYALDPELGWEVQKFIVTWAYAYLPENQQTAWFDMMRVYREGDDTPPDIQGQKLVWRDPLTGVRYTALGYGTEVIRGRTVQKGIAARVLEYANQLTAAAYEITSIDPATGEITLTIDKQGKPIVKPNTSYFDAQGCPHDLDATGHPLTGLKANQATGQCEPISGEDGKRVGADGRTLDNNYVDPDFGQCESNTRCVELKNYKSLPDLLFTAARHFGLTTGGLKGVY